MNALQNHHRFTSNFASISLEFSDVFPSFRAKGPKHCMCQRYSLVGQPFRSSSTTLHWLALDALHTWLGPSAMCAITTQLTQLLTTQARTIRGCIAHAARSLTGNYTLIVVLEGNCRGAGGVSFFPTMVTLAFSKVRHVSTLQSHDINCFMYPARSLWSGGGGGGWHEAMVLVCLPLAAPIGLWPSASNGQVALSALGSGRACPTAVIAFCPSADTRRFHSARCVQRSALAPAPAIRAGCLGSTGFCVHPGQWSLPSCAAWIAGPIWPHMVGL